MGSVRYDQLGSGQSDFIRDTSFFEIERFVEELQARPLAPGRYRLAQDSVTSPLAAQASTGTSCR